MKNWNTDLQKTEVVLAAASLEGQNSLEWYKITQNLTLVSILPTEILG